MAAVDGVETPNPALVWWDDVKKASHNIFELLDKLVTELVAAGLPLGSSQDVTPTDTQDGVIQ